MKYSTFIFSTFLILSCKSSQKNISTLKTEQETNINKEVRITEDVYTTELTDKFFRKLIGEDLSVIIKHTKYDTSNLIQENGSKHPILEENITTINKKTIISEEDSVFKKEEIVSTLQTSDNSNINIERKNEIKTEEKKGIMNWSNILII